MKKILLEGILGGIAAFIWSAIAHMNPVTGMLGWSMMIEKDEDAVIAALKANLHQPGLYFFPGCEMTGRTKEQEAVWTAKCKAGPVGLLLYDPNGREPMEPKQLVI